MATWGDPVVGSEFGNMWLGYDLTRTGVDFNTTSITWTLTIYFRTEYKVSDTSNKLNVSGSWSLTNKSTNISIPSGGGTVALWTGTYTQSGLGWGSTSSPSFSATLSGVEYQYNRSVSVSGSDSATVPTPSAPSAPGISVAALGNGYVDFSFSAPAYGGDGGVSRYESSTDNVNWGTQNSNPFRHTGTNGTTVYGYIRAVNAYNQAGPSSGTSGIPRTVPSAPKSFTGNNSTFGQISLSWAAPDSTGGNVPVGGMKYVLRNGTTILQDSTSTSYTHAGLLPYTDYTYTVTAKNDAGEGTASTITVKTMGGIAKVFNSISPSPSYVTVLPKVYNGSTWVDAQARMYDGIGATEDAKWKHGI